MSAKGCGRTLKNPEKPCAILDSVGKRKGWRIALFDEKDTPKGYLVVGNSGCSETTDIAKATVFKTMGAVEGALNKCRMEPCPP